MLTGLFSSEIAERVLLYITAYGEGHARGIAAAFTLPVTPVRNQLINFEARGILVSQMKGRTRLFLWNPRYPFLKELQALLERSLEFLPPEEYEKYSRRTRPRRTGKSP